MVFNQLFKVYSAIYKFMEEWPTAVCSGNPTSIIEVCTVLWILPRNSRGLYWSLSEPPFKNKPLGFWHCSTLALLAIFLKKGTLGFKPWDIPHTHTHHTHITYIYIYRHIHTLICIYIHIYIYIYIYIHMYVVKKLGFRVDLSIETTPQKS